MTDRIPAAKGGRGAPLVRSESSRFYRRLDCLFRNEYHLSDVNQLAALFAGEILQTPKGVLLVQRAAFHQDSLGLLDGLAVFESLAQISRFFPQSLELLEPPHRQSNGRLQIGLLDRLYQ